MGYSEFQAVIMTPVRDRGNPESSIHGSLVSLHNGMRKQKVFYGKKNDRFIEVHLPNGKQITLVRDKKGKTYAVYNPHGFQWWANTAWFQKNIAEIVYLPGGKI